VIEQILTFERMMNDYVSFATGLVVQSKVRIPPFNPCDIIHCK